jgi:hypothetical protein
MYNGFTFLPVVRHHSRRPQAMVQMANLFCINCVHNKSKLVFEKCNARTAYDASRDVITRLVTMCAKRHVCCNNSIASHLPA